jgi:serine protease Do
MRLHAPAQPGLRRLVHAHRFALVWSAITCVAAWMGNPPQEAMGESPVVTRFSSNSLRNSPVVKAIKNAEPAVVNIQGNKTINTTSSSSGAGGKQEVNGMGTGVIIDARGYIITNLHVVQDVSKIEVTLADGTKTDAKLINYDPQTDLAMIRINVARQLPVIPIGSSYDLMRGETVIAIGNPFGYQHTVTVGVISALHRDIPVNGTQEYHDLIQTNADINPGNSGGPLVNIDGEVIGINVAVRVGAQGIGFAIPIDAACEVMADLVSDANPNDLDHGLSLETIHLESQTRTRIARTAVSVASTSTGELQAGDVIISVAGQPVRHRMDVELAMLERRRGDEVEVVIDREGQPVSHMIRLDKQTASTESRLAQDAWEKLGVRLTSVSRQALGDDAQDYSGGLKVLEVRTGSQAEREGLVAGDIIVGILRWQTPNINALQWVLKSEEFNTSVSAKFYLVRNNEPFWVAMKPSKSKTR